MNLVWYGMQVTMIGMLVVFAGLLILIFAIYLMRKAIKGKPEPKEEQNDLIEPLPMAMDSAAIVKGNQEDALIALITAAVAATLAGEHSTLASNGFVVRAIRRIHGTPAWNRAGREEQVYSRF